MCRKVDERVTLLESQLAWLESHAEILVRPLSLISHEDEVDHRLRQLIGEVTYDAVALALSEQGLLWANDVVLMQLLRTEVKWSDIRCTNTFDLVECGVQRGLFTEQGGYARILDLVFRGWCSPTLCPQLIDFALRAQCDSRVINRIFEFLVDNPIGKSAAIVAAVAKCAAVAPIQTFSEMDVVRRAACVNSPHWPAGLWKKELLASLRQEFALLPRQLDQIAKLF